ncbi:MAG: phosphoribosyltransferase family protein, partial [Pseudomonadota bacterium]
SLTPATAVPPVAIRSSTRRIFSPAWIASSSTIAETYVLEYGEDEIEIHDDAIQAGEKILLVDDLIATGGTAVAGVKLIEKVGGEIVLCSFVIDLPDLGGAAKLRDMGHSVESLMAFEGH